MLSTSVKPQSFSIAAHATVGQNTVRLLAIVERVATTEQGAQPRHEVTIKKYTRFEEDTLLGKMKRA